MIGTNLASRADVIHDRNHLRIQIKRKKVGFTRNKMKREIRVGKRTR